MRHTVTLGDRVSSGSMRRTVRRGADVVVRLSPGGKGTHVELSIAIAQGRRMILHSPDEVINNLETTSRSTTYLSSEVPRNSGRPLAISSAGSGRCPCLTRFVPQSASAGLYFSRGWTDQLEVCIHAELWTKFYWVCTY